MFTRLVVPAIVAGFVSLAGTAQAQSTSAPYLAITPYAGYMMFGDFLTGPLGTRLASANGTVYGAQVTLPVTQNIAVIGNIARSQPSLQIGIPFLGGISVGQTSIWMYDGGLQLSLPISGNGIRSITPFAQVGAGAMRYNVDVVSLRTQATNFAFNAGLGADVSFSRNVGLRFMAKDYIGKFDFKEATSFDVQSKVVHNWAFTAGLKLAF